MRVRRVVSYVTRTTLEFTLTEEQVDDGVLDKIRTFARNLGVDQYATDSFDFDPDDPTSHYGRST